MVSSGKKVRLIGEIFKKGIFPVVIIILLLLLYVAYVAKIKSGLKENWQVIISKSYFVLATIFISYSVRSIVIGILNWYSAKIATRTSTFTDNKFIPLFRLTASIVIWIIGLIIILSRLGVNISALLATLGVGSLAIALAAQDTISNIIAGFLIMIDQPFRVNDSIKLPSGEKVKVLNIGMRRSRFLTEDSAIVIVPNLDLSKSKIINYTYGEMEKK